jgi:hypothetical protein
MTTVSRTSVIRESNIVLADTNSIFSSFKAASLACLSAKTVPFLKEK